MYGADECIVMDPFTTFSLGNWHPQMWKHSKITSDGKEVILIFGDEMAGEKGWIVAEMPCLDHPDLQREQEERAIMICGVPLAYKVLQDIKDDALALASKLDGISSELVGQMQSIAIQADRALVYGPPFSDGSEE